MRRASLVAGALCLGLVVALALVSYAYVPFDPARVDAAARLLPPLTRGHLLGTDGFGLDIWSRIMVGARTCLLVGVIAVGTAAVVGVPIGICAGMITGWGSMLILRAGDVLYAFPALLLAILLAAAKGASVGTAMTAIGIASVPAFIRIARAGTLPIMASDYVLAARASGTSRAGIAVRHVLPNIAALVGVQSSVAFGIAILAEAALSYLGLSAPPSTITWGRMLRDAQNYIFSDPMIAVWPGLAIGIAVLGCNLLGDGLRDLLDPRLREGVR